MQALNYGRPLATGVTIIGMRIGARVRKLREALGIKQGELARMVGIKQSTLSDLERGDSRRPRGDTLTGLAEALRVTPEHIISGEEPPLQARKPEDPDVAELMDLYKQLTRAHRAALLATARALVESTDHHAPPPARKPQLRQQQ